MRQAQHDLTIETSGQRLYEFTDHVKVFLARTAIETGALTIYCRHTSASLLIQENADPDVQRDLTEFYARLVPQDMTWLRHTAEGPDDMPAHIKAALTATTMTIPVARRKLTLGTWQGVYLFEHRDAPHRRRIVLHAIGE
ncbi:MAG: secondary thiamine-phosphate synthase enzyme YjbQ [Pseudomonadota bacterium]